MKLKKRFSKDKKKISLIGIVVGGVFGIGAYMGTFERQLFENGWEIVKDLGNNWNLLGVVKKGPMETRKINVNEGSDLTKSEKWELGNLSLEKGQRLEKKTMDSNEGIWENDFELDETGWKFQTPAFENVLKGWKSKDGNIEVDKRRLERTGGGKILKISPKIREKFGRENEQGIRKACLENDFDWKAFVGTWLVKKEEEKLKTKREAFCQSKKNQVEEYLREKLIEERKTSAVFNWLRQSKILIAGNHIYIKFDGLGIYIGKEYFLDSSKKKGWRLSLQTLKEIKEKKENHELKQKGEKVKKINVEKKGTWKTIKVLQNIKDERIFKVESDYENELKEYEEALNEISEMIGIQKGDYSGIDQKLGEYKNEFRKEQNKEKEEIDQFRKDDIVGKEINLTNEKFNKIPFKEKQGGFLIKEGEKKIGEKEKKLNDLRIRVEKKVNEKLSIFGALEILEKKMNRNKDGIKTEILKLDEKRGKKFEEIYNLKEEKEENSYNQQEWERFLKIIAILNAGTDKKNYQEIKEFKVKGELTDFDSIKEANDFLEKNKNDSENDYGIPTGELITTDNKEEFPNVGKVMEIDKVYPKQSSAKSNGHKIVGHILVKEKDNSMNYGEIIFHRMIDSYNKVSQGKENPRKEEDLSELQAKWEIARSYVKQNNLMSEMIVPDYSVKRLGERLKLTKNKKMQMADPGDVGKRIESEIYEMVSRQIVIKSLDYGRNLTENEKRELKSEYQGPSRYAYVAKKGSKIDIPEGYCKVATVEDGKNRSGYLPFGWVCVKNKQLMIFD